MDSEGKTGFGTAGSTPADDDNVDDDDDEEAEEDDEEPEDSSDDADSRLAHYSSSLLQKFVESTERLSGKRNSLLGRSFGSKRSSVGGKYKGINFKYF